MGRLSEIEALPVDQNEERAIFAEVVPQLATVKRGSAALDLTPLDTGANTSNVEDHRYCQEVGSALRRLAEEFQNASLPKRNLPTAERQLLNEAGLDLAYRLQELVDLSAHISTIGERGDVLDALADCLASAYCIGKHGRTSSRVNVLRPHGKNQEQAEAFLRALRKTIDEWPGLEYLCEMVWASHPDCSKISARCVDRLRKKIDGDAVRSPGRPPKAP